MIKFHQKEFIESIPYEVVSPEKSDRVLTNLETLEI